MKRSPHDQIELLGTQLFQAAGAPEPDAEIVARSLVQSSLMGHDSHGVLRIPEYLQLIAVGTIVPKAAIKVTCTSNTTAIVDSGLNFGAVGGDRAIRTGIELAAQHKTACVTTRRCNHVGRLGAYVQTAAENGLIAIATCNSPIHGHFVLPWGGREARLATNPIAYGIPTGSNPIVADFSTSVAPEGKIRVYHNEQKALPEGWILDADGEPTVDSKQFYGPPRGGILPLGGSAGHKGYALSLLVEILGCVLNGISSMDAHTVGNGVCFLVIDPSAFCPLKQFRKLVDDTIAYVKSSPPAPGVEEVLVPGELEFQTMNQRQVDGIPIDDPTWQRMEAHARRLGVNLV